MAITYTYDRRLITDGGYAGSYDIDNPNCVDEHGNKISLASQIKEALPGKVFKVECKILFCYIHFDEEITAGENTALDTLVADHRALRGYDPDSKTFREKKYMVTEANNNKIASETWYAIDNGDETYSGIVEKTEYIYDNKNLLSRTETKYYKDGTIAESKTWDYYTNNKNTILKLREA